MIKVTRVGGQELDRRRLSLTRLDKGSGHGTK